MRVNKVSLEPGDALKHFTLGPVVFTSRCANLEQEHGEEETLFVEVGGEVRCVTLALLDRNEENK